MQFYVPSNMVENYKDFLQTEVCHTIKWCRNIFAETPIWNEERVEISSVNFKSKQYGSDNTTRMRMAKDSVIQKGDVILYDNKEYIVTWNINDDRPDSRACMIELLTTPITFKRFKSAIVDEETGNIIEPDKYEPLFPTIRCMHIMNGNFEIRLKNSQAGLLPNNRLTISMQANPETFKLRKNDIFDLYGETHIIHDILYTEIGYDGETGLIVVHAEIAALDGDI
jgi:hypothetical protein